MLPQSPQPTGGEYRGRIEVLITESDLLIPFVRPRVVSIQVTTFKMEVLKKWLSVSIPVFPVKNV